MTIASTHPDIRASFQAAPDGFTSRNGGGFISCPPYVIAAVAADRIPAEALEWPEGYHGETLERIKDITGWVDRDVHISARQAGELADLGRQILALGEGQINPPLGYFERQSIEHLVGATANESL